MVALAALLLACQNDSEPLPPAPHQLTTDEALAAIKQFNESYCGESTSDPGEKETCQQDLRDFQERVDEFLLDAGAEQSTDGTLSFPNNTAAYLYADSDKSSGWLLKDTYGMIFAPTDSADPEMTDWFDSGANSDEVPVDHVRIDFQIPIPGTANHFDPLGINVNLYESHADTPFDGMGFYAYDGDFDDTIDTYEIVSGTFPEVEFHNFLETEDDPDAEEMIPMLEQGLTAFADMVSGTLQGEADHTSEISLHGVFELE